MYRLEVSAAIRHIYMSLGFKKLRRRCKGKDHPVKGRGGPRGSG